MSCTAVGGLCPLLVSLPLMFLNGSVLDFRDHGLLGVVAIMGPLVAAIALRPVGVRSSSAARVPVCFAADEFSVLCCQLTSVRGGPGVKHTWHSVRSSAPAKNQWLSLGIACATLRYLVASSMQPPWQSWPTVER